MKHFRFIFTLLLVFASLTSGRADGGSYKTGAVVENIWIEGTPVWGGFHKLHFDMVNPTDTLVTVFGGYAIYEILDDAPLLIQMAWDLKTIEMEPGERLPYAVLVGSESRHAKMVIRTRAEAQYFFPDEVFAYYEVDNASIDEVNVEETIETLNEVNENGEIIPLNDSLSLKFTLKNNSNLYFHPIHGYDHRIYDENDKLLTKFGNFVPGMQAGESSDFEITLVGVPSGTYHIITDYYLSYNHMYLDPHYSFTVAGVTDAVTDISNAYTSSSEFFTLSGERIPNVSDVRQLPHGMYIEKRGEMTKKVMGGK